MVSNLHFGSYLEMLQVVKIDHGPLTRYAKTRVAHAPGMPGAFSLPRRVSDPDMHHGTCVMHGPWCIPGQLTSGFLWIRWRGNHIWLSRLRRNPQFYVSGTRPMKRSRSICFSHESDVMPSFQLNYAHRHQIICVAPKAIEKMSHRN